MVGVSKKHVHIWSETNPVHTAVSSHNLKEKSFAADIKFD